MAIALRAFVPQGYMVAPNAQPGSYPIVLCTSQGAQTVNIDATGHIARSPSKAPPGHPGNQKGDHPCAFSGFGAAFAAEAPMLVAMADWGWIDQAIVFEPQTTPGRGLAAPPPPPTGPPLQI
jgi:hypothetical protein